MWKGDYIQFTEQEEFKIGTIHHDFIKLSEPKCSDGKVDVTSLLRADKDKGSIGERRSTTLKGTITEVIALLKTRQDRTLLENYIVSKAAERLPAVAIDDKELKSFRDPAARLRKCEGLSSAESLQITLEQARIIEPLILTGTELEHYGFRKRSDQDLTWALIDLPSPACGGGPKALWFVKIGRFWYMQG
jgi:hypothetical protein